MVAREVREFSVGWSTAGRRGALINNPVLCFCFTSFFDWRDKNLRRPLNQPEQYEYYPYLGQVTHVFPRFWQCAFQFSSANNDMKICFDLPLQLVRFRVGNSSNNEKQIPHQSLADVSSSREWLEITAAVHKLYWAKVKNLQEIEPNIKKNGFRLIWHVLLV